MPYIFHPIITYCASYKCSHCYPRYPRKFYFAFFLYHLVKFTISKLHHSFHEKLKNQEFEDQRSKLSILPMLLYASLNFDKCSMKPTNSLNVVL